MDSLISKYLAENKVLQVASAVNNEPWVCTVYFVTDDELNVYWLSEPQVRHSQNIESNPRTAITMAIKTDMPVIGLSAEGASEIVNDLVTVEQVMAKYIDKYEEGKQFVERFKQGINKHQLYKFTPEKYVLFDEVNYPNEGSKIYEIKDKK